MRIGVTGGIFRWLLSNEGLLYDRTSFIYIYIYATGSETDQCTASQPMLHSVIVVVTPG